MGSVSTQNTGHAMNHWVRMQWLARSCIWVLTTCPACGANGCGRLTAAVTLLLLAVARQFGIAHVVPHQRLHDVGTEAPVEPVHKEALVMGHLVRERV